jgi:NADP-dependent 3-hydroxy acid dehydrogenase YdfG
MKRERTTSRVAIVTGATSGIGRATAIALGREGYALVLSGRREAELLTLATELRTLGAESATVSADIADRASADRLVQTALSRFDGLDAVICCAGRYVRGPVATRTAADFEEALSVNFYGVLHLVYAALPHFLQKHSGHLVAVSSIDGKKGLPLDAPYVASKSALTGFFDVLRQELRGTGVRVLTVLPGRVDTPMIATLRVPAVSAKIPPERVARTIARGVRRGWSKEIVGPPIGGWLLVALSALSPQLGDFLIRVFHLEGREKAAA